MVFRLFFHVSLLTFLVFTSSCTTNEAHFSCGIGSVSQEGINHLQPLIEAMENYKKDNGSYPASYTDLIPKYLTRVPVINSGGVEEIDETKFFVLKSDSIYRDVGVLAKDGTYFKLVFIPKDDRTCLFGRNNICEYSSNDPRWDCHQ